MARVARGFMGQTWDGGDIAFRPETWSAVLRVLKPGGYLLAMGGTRTYHRLVCAIEDAGFEIRDTIAWVYGSGFPKSHNVGKGIDAKIIAGSARTEDIRRIAMGGDYVPSGRGRVNYDHGGGSVMNGAVESGQPLTIEGRPYAGWGTALKPAFEPIVIARKPLRGTVAENVMEYGTGALNIDGCRIGSTKDDTGIAGGIGDDTAIIGLEMGRWPANLIHDGSDEVLDAFPSAPGQLADASPTAPSARTKNTYGKMSREGEESADRRYTENGSTNFAALPGQRRSDKGSAARFFYCAKASKADRGESNPHPTVKPTALMQYLCRLVTPPDGTVLDPFMGSGSTGKAALAESFNFIGIEQEEKYFQIAQNRLGQTASLSSLLENLKATLLENLFAREADAI
jgi:site-specific DNA-methyltransferase (adenine-specific)